jgi:hypothetical protein
MRWTAPSPSSPAWHRRSDVDSYLADVALPTPVDTATIRSGSTRNVTVLTLGWC